jgi:hypothetical protein
MYVVSRHLSPLSPHIMRFENLWIYDLRPFHDFWKKTVLEKNISQSNTSIAWDDSAWGALLKIYGIHTFAPTKALEVFAQDYHQHFQTKISPQGQRKFFDVMRRLGLNRIGHLQRLSFVEIGKRFGRAWADFMKGVFEPQKTPWPWEKFRIRDPLRWSENLDEPSASSEFILDRLMYGIQSLAQENHCPIEKIEFSLIFGERENVELQFSHAILLSKEHDWIRKLLQERLFSLQLQSSVSRLEICASPAEPGPIKQLSLFDSQAPKIALESLCKKLENQGFQVFKPSPSPSYIPENSWFRVSPLVTQTSPKISRAYLRPLIQFQPRTIATPTGILKKTEQVEWCDLKGQLRSRTYYMTRKNRYWAWVFQTNDGQWFEQGVIE